MRRYYTIQQIFRQKLLKNYRGKPFRHIESVARIVRTNLKYKKRPGPGGFLYLVSESEIKRYNNRYV